MEDQDKWFMEIERVHNGYVVRYLVHSEGGSFWETNVLEGNEKDELANHESLLYLIMDFFNFGGGRYDAQRLRIKREPGDKYEQT